MFTAIKNFALKNIILEIKDIRSSIQLNQLHNSYLPWTGASIRPTALVYLINDILINDRDIIVECGTGISTIHIACLLKQIGNNNKRLYAIEHDANWLSYIKRELEKNQSDEFVTLIHAPLRNSANTLSKNTDWYDTSILDSNTPKSNIDLLIIDGPPANKKGQEWARYPALPYFIESLSDNYAVILDDADRKGEAYIIDKWQEEYRLAFHKFILKGNIYIGGNADTYNV